MYLYTLCNSKRKLFYKIFEFIIICKVVVVVFMPAIKKKVVLRCLSLIICKVVVVVFMPAIKKKVVL